MTMTYYDQMKPNVEVSQWGVIFKWLKTFLWSNIFAYLCPVIAAAWDDTGGRKSRVPSPDGEASPHWDPQHPKQGLSASTKLLYGVVVLYKLRIHWRLIRYDKIAAHQRASEWLCIKNSLIKKNVVRIDSLFNRRKCVSLCVALNCANHIWIEH